MNSISALTKSCSFIPYFSYKIFRIFNFIFSSISPLYGMLPIRIFNSSASIPSFRVFFSCLLAKCGSKSAIVNIGSFSSSPIFISIFSLFSFRSNLVLSI